MSYQFAGFFAKPPIEPPTQLPKDAIWRRIASPFAGVGLCLPSLLGESTSAVEISKLAQELGIELATDWLFIRYECWGGDIDSVYGLGRRGANTFGPIEDVDIDTVGSAYLSLMSSFGISEDDAMRFPPFERGYWEDV